MEKKLQSVIPNALFSLAERCPAPLYLVGGTVRDTVAGLIPLPDEQEKIHRDFDICAPMPYETFTECAAQAGFEIKSVFKATGTVKCKDRDGIEYEYSCFRSDKYVRGTHVPVEIYFTQDIELDARRRDFTANAVYYDINKGEFLDPLDGLTAIKEKRLSTVAPAKKVFGEDGLRLMRLARQAAQLGFAPDEECFWGAKKNAELIKDISPERVFTELTALLTADTKYGVKDGPYQGLKLLEETSVLVHILPELALGKNMVQRADFHKYDVLEHSLRAVKYADYSIRLAALLHDVGKPFCKLRDGNSYAHPQEGASLAKEILTRLRAPKKSIQRIPALIEWHMYDFDCKTKETKLRRFFVTHQDILQELLLVKQADFSACMDDLSIAPTCKRWKTLLEQMKEEGVPFSVKELTISGKDIAELGIPLHRIAAILQKLLLHLSCNPKDNTKERLKQLAISFSKENSI